MCVRRAAAVLAGLVVLTPACGVEPTTGIDVGPPSESSGEIRYGDETTAFPAVGLLEISINGMVYLCSGTLIAPDLVLTAAHCVVGATPDATFFRVAASSTSAARPTYGASAIVVAPGYAAVGDANTPDLAVVRLSGDVPGVAPLPLAAAGPAEGTTLLGVGFGQDETNGAAGLKRMGTMVLTSTTRGSAGLPGGGSYAPALFELQPGSAQQISCPGDSGGPLIDGSGAVVGVASFITLPAGTPPGQYCTSAYRAGYVSVPDTAPLLASLMGALPPAPAVPGACQLDDAAFSTDAGGCRDLETGLVFSRRLPRARQSRAVARCRDLVEGGYSDWRLPTANELRSMARNGGATHLAGGSASRLWSRSRAEEDGLTVKMSTGAKRRSARDQKRSVYCVRDG